MDKLPLVLWLLLWWPCCHAARWFDRGGKESPIVDGATAGLALTLWLVQFAIWVGVASTL